MELPSLYSACKVCSACVVITFQNKTTLGASQLAPHLFGAKKDYTRRDEKVEHGSKPGAVTFGRALLEVETNSPSFKPTGLLKLAIH